MKLSPFESELVDRVKKLEEKVDQLMSLNYHLRSTQPLDNNHCKVCGIRWGESAGYVCLRNTCPAKITTS